MIDEIWTMMVVVGVFWLVGLALCIGVPLLVCHIFHLKVNLWLVSIISALVWIAGTYIWYNMPI